MFLETVTVTYEAKFTSQVFPLTKYSMYGDEVCFISVWMASSDTSLKTEVILDFLPNNEMVKMMSNVNKGVPAFLGVSGRRVWRKLGPLSRILLHQPLGVV